MNMDRELHDALQRKQAPDDLADRVLARINSGQADAVRTGGGSNPVMRELDAAGVLAIAAGDAEH